MEQRSSHKRQQQGPPLCDCRLRNLPSRVVRCGSAFPLLSTVHAVRVCHHHNSPHRGYIHIPLLSCIVQSCTLNVCLLGETPHPKVVTNYRQPSGCSL
ncbi:hypothetical protein B0I35DRAFT_430912 [Stachybotrys elegans]|uniref:Uncharacterized protein n=1 Tax=Stachybotrys elegans TaxID=80388 RepID=A0A8K0WSU7_9HYPO|nr:hypothetical protein B0I35DRAFT_430912 [Stachybotrys elegans]